MTNSPRRSHEVTSTADVVALPGFGTWLAANLGRFRPGSVNHIQFMHDHACQYPSGGPCTCVPGPEIRVMGEQPERN